MRPPCKFHSSPGGCRNGEACRFSHSIGGGEISRGPAAGRGRGRGSVSASAGGRGFSTSSSATKQLLAQLGSSLDPPADVVQRWVHLALAQCDRDQAHWVLQDLKSTDGCHLLRAAALQMTQPEAPTNLLGVLVPLLKLLTSEQVRLDLPVLATMHDSLSLSALSSALEALSAAAPAGDETYIKRNMHGSMVLSCTPKDWLDVLQPITSYLQEVTSRFSGSLQQTPGALDGATTLLKTLAAAFNQHLPAESTAAHSRTAEYRRLLNSLQLLERQLQAHMGRSEAVEQLAAAQKRFEVQQKQQAKSAAAAASTPGPGELHPSGAPRHNNDKVSHDEISVAPTREEALCTQKPFLPANRPGSLPHAAHDPDRAHRELHYRLLRHDVVGPVCDAAQAFAHFGGVAGFKSLKGQVPGFSTRLHLKVGRDVQDITVYRNVSVMGLTTTYNGGIAIRVEFDDAPQLAKADQPRRFDWWKHTKQLQHGSLLFLWWDGEPRGLPNMMFATVCDRKEQDLAPRGERRRPQLGLRMCGEPVTTELMAAVLGRQRLGGKKEVVIVPAAGSFFAYEPILKALQATHPLPLAKYILYDQNTTGSGNMPQPLLLRGQLVTGSSGTGGSGGAVDVPAYAAGANCLYDLTAVTSQDRLKDLSTADLHRLQRLCPSSPGGIPVDLLQRATTLDESQAAALAACLTRELAVVQGPPGCGKTYIGVQLVRLLLANTRSSPDCLQSEAALSSIPWQLRPLIGPILVLCYTNHALDAFLMDLVNCGITEGIIRVGRRSNCPELEKYNLKAKEGGQARGREVASCRQRVEELKGRVNGRLDKLRSSRTVRRLQLDDVYEWLQLKHPALAESLSFRAYVIEHAAFLEAAAVDPDDGFQQQTRRRKNKRGQQQQHAQQGWVWGQDVLQDWLNSSPEQDWLREQWMQQRMQQWEQDAARGFTEAPVAGSSSDGFNSGSADAGYAAGADAGSSTTASSNPFAALAPEWQQGTDDSSTFLAELQGAQSLTEDSTTASSQPLSVSSNFGEWLMLDEPGSAAAAAAGAAAVQELDQESGDEGWEVASLDSSNTAAEGQEEPASSSVPGSPSSAAASPSAQAHSDQHSPSPQHQQQQPQQDLSSSRRPAAAPAGVEPQQAAPDEIREFEALNRPIDELLLLEDIQGMTRPERLRLYQHLADTLAIEWGSDINDLVTELEEQQKKLKELYDRAALQVLRGARIVGMTTTGLANQQGLLHGLQPKLVIVEEAAEVLEAHILTSLAPTVEHLVLIGDHFQLSPKVEVYELQKESGRGYDLNKSMFERLVEAGTVQHVTLQTQRRMRPEIAELIRAPLYPLLKDHPAVTAYPHVKGMTRDLFFWDHDVKEGGTDQGKSRFNEHEVQACVGLARYLLQQGYGGSEQPDICILTPYVGQLLRLRQAIAAVSDVKFVMSDRDATDLNNVLTDASMPDSTFAADGDEGNGSSLAGAGSRIVTMGRSIRLATIDNFQGEEARIIILSLVRNPREQGAGIGFLAVDNRINVLLSRAKEGMYLIGSSAALSAAADKAIAAGRSCMWAPVLEHLSTQGCLGKSLQVCCQRHSNMTDVTRPHEFAQLVGDGGCQQPCGLKLPCGHTCPRRCHADDPQHIQTKCLKPCGKLCALERHACNRLCWEPCTACAALEETVELPCGHTAKNVPCCKAVEPGKIPCTELVTTTYPGCQHTLTVPCSRSAAYLAGSEPCTQQVQVTLPGCGHTLTLPCSKAALALLDPTCCTARCGGLLPGCEHECTSSCGKCKLLLLQGSAGSSDSSSGTVQPAFTGLVDPFLGDLAGMPDLSELWTQWCEDNAAAVQQLSPAQKWLRFLKSGLAAGLGTRQCKELATTVSASSSSSSSSTECPWEPYICSRSMHSMHSAPERLAALWQAQLVSASATGTQRPHMPCSKVCDRPLACGHSCEMKCHQGSSCGPCRKPCSIACQHTKCSGACAAPCAPCAEPCEWSCSHKGPCLLPCGVPCDREPCNMRCDKRMKCGHRCPGLCGEECLPQKYCVDPRCMGKASEALKGRVVDMVMFKTFGELTDADVTADPLILLQCGHLISTSTLDGHMAMAEAYDISSSSSTTTTSSSSNSKSVPAGSDTPPSSTAAGNSSSSINEASSSPSDLEPWGTPKHRSDFPQPKHCPNCRGLIAGVKRYGRIVLHSQLGVTQRKYAEAVRCQLSSSRAELHRLQDSLLSPSASWRDNSSMAAADRLISRKKPLAAGMLSELSKGAAAAEQIGLKFHHLGQSSYRTPKASILGRTRAALLSAARAQKLAPAAAQMRLDALMRVPIKIDKQPAFEAAQGQASSAQLSLTLAARQLEALAAGLEAVGDALSRETLAEDLGRRYNSRAGKAGWLADQSRELQAQVPRIAAHADKTFDSTAQVVRWAIDAAANDGCHTASYRASHSLMLLLLERASQLQPFKQPALARIMSSIAAATATGRRGTPAQSGEVQQLAERVHKQQMQLLQQAEDAAQAALQLFAIQKQQWAAEAEDAGVAAEQLPFAHMPNEAIEAVRGLLEKLPQIKNELSEQAEAAEVAAVLAAVMKTTRCVQCGARIGGNSHQLDPSNRRANAALRTAVATAAQG